MHPKKVLKFQKEEVISDKKTEQIFNYAKLKEELQIDVVRVDDQMLEMQIKGINAATANALRRIIIAEIPTVAFHKVFMYQNTSVIPDELLVHRLGLIPLRIDPNDLEQRGDNEELNGQNSVKFELKVVCRRKKEFQKMSEQYLQSKQPE